MKKRRFSSEQKQAVVNQIETALSSGAIKDRKAELTRRKIADSVYYKWRKQFPPSINSPSASVFNINEVLGSAAEKKNSAKKHTAKTASSSTREQLALAVIALLSKILGS